jgi:hypothetical protein
MKAGFSPFNQKINSIGFSQNLYNFKLKKIAYIEIDTHAEIAADFMDLMRDSKEFSVDYYFSERILKQVGNHHQNICLSDSSMILEQLKNQKYDLVILGTVHRYFGTFLEITKRFSTSVIVHNINFSTISKVQLFKNIFKEDFAYRLKLWLKESLFSAPKVYQNAKNCFVLDSDISLQKLKFLPLFYTKNISEKTKDIFTVVIPGGVSQKRRDYKKVCKEILALDSEFKNDDGFQSRSFEFVFLGKAKGEELQLLSNLEKSLKNISIKYFKERLSAEDFDDWMMKADVLWCPIQSETEFFSQKEIYGKTKMTGNLADAIKYGKVAIFPSNYSSEFEFIVNEKPDFKTQLKELNSFSFDFQKDFNKDKIQQSLEKVLKSVI